MIQKLDYDLRVCRRTFPGFVRLLSVSNSLLFQADSSHMQVSALLTASFASLEIFLICGLWQGTQDLSAAIPAALVMYGADVAGAYKDLKSQQSQS